jgi:hypothetical protein
MSETWRFRPEGGDVRKAGAAVLKGRMSGRLALPSRCETDVLETGDSAPSQSVFCLKPGVSNLWTGNDTRRSGATWKMPAAPVRLQGGAVTTDGRPPKGQAGRTARPESRGFGRIRSPAGRPGRRFGWFRGPTGPGRRLGWIRGPTGPGRRLGGIRAPPDGQAGVSGRSGPRRTASPASRGDPGPCRAAVSRPGTREGWAEGRRSAAWSRRGSRP